MKLKHFEDINEYYEYVKPYLIQQEAHHNLLFGVISELKSKPENSTQSPYLVTVEEDNKLV